MRSRTGDGGPAVGESMVNECHTGPTSPRRRGGWGVAAVLVVACLAGCVRQRLVAELTRADMAPVQSPGLTLVLCGTGTGLVDAQRAGPCTAIVAAGQLFLVDVGPGAWKSADLLGLPITHLRGIFFTKLLADDIADLGEAMTRGWIAGREERLAVYGPSGTRLLVDSLNAAYQFDVSMRLAHHQATHLSPELAGADAHEFVLDQADGSAVVLERDGLRVTAFSVGQIGTAVSVGYRFEYRGRTVVIAGHSRGHPNVIRFAAGADVLVHEATHHEMLAYGIEVMDGIGHDRSAYFTREMLAFYADPQQAAEVARAAGVGRLVLTRLSPPPNDILMRRMFLSGARSIFPDVELGEDGMRLYLAPRP